MKRLPSTPEQIESALATCPYLDIVPWRLIRDRLGEAYPTDQWCDTTPVHILVEAMIAERVEQHDLITRRNAELREVKAENERLRDAARTLCSAVDVTRLFEVET